jgi:hypothetical protein
MEKMASRPTLSLQDEVVVVGVKSVITIDDYSFSDGEDSEVQFLKTTSDMLAYQQEQDVVVVKQVKKGNAPRSHTPTTALEDKDYAMAVAVAEQDGWCSQYTRKRQRSRPFKCNICLEENLDG